MKIEHGWQPIALSGSVDPATSAGVLVEGMELVIWRDAYGAIRVWEDRCPHRGMRLSLGFVRGDHIACLYHGWQYDGEGICRHIPAHPDLDVPRSISVTAFRAVEQNGIVWVTGSTDAPAPAPVAGQDWTPLRSLFVDAAGERVIAALATVGKRTERADTLIIETMGYPIACAVQERMPGHCAIHMVVMAAPGQEELVSLLRWAERLRGRLESEAMTGAA